MTRYLIFFHQIEMRMTVSTLFEQHRLDDWNQPVTIANPLATMTPTPNFVQYQQHFWQYMLIPSKKKHELIILPSCLILPKKNAPILITTPVIGFSPIFSMTFLTPKNTYPSLPTSCRLTSRLGYWQKRLLR